MFTATSSLGGSGKPCFVFVVDVQRIDITAQQDDGEDLHWTVQRRYSEFYALEAKLTEFHGEFEDIRLPPKAKFSLWKGLDVLQAKREVNQLCFFRKEFTYFVECFWILKRMEMYMIKYMFLFHFRHLKIT